MQWSLSGTAMLEEGRRDKYKQRGKYLQPQLAKLGLEIWTPYLVRLGVVAGVLEGEQVQSRDIVLGATGVEGG